MSEHAGRDPVRRVVDAFVTLPVCTAVAIGRSVPLVMHAGARGLAGIAARAVGEADELDRDSSSGDSSSGESGAGDPEAAGVATVPGAGEEVSAEADTPESVARSAADLPIEGYDQLAARQIVDRLSGLTADELDAVGAYERANRHRRTVLGKIDQLTS